MNENTPLLSRSPSNEDPQTYRHHVISVWQTWRIPILCYIAALCLDFAETMRATPKTQLYESILCERFYTPKPEDPSGLVLEITDRMCKVPEVQGALVSMQAWLKMGENLTALIVAIPFGKLSNTKGRTLVLILGILGQILADASIVVVCYFHNIVPLELLFASVALRSIGGGTVVLSAIVHAIIADVVSEERRAQAFFYLASTQLVSEVIAPLLGSTLMETSVYNPLLLGFPLQILSIAVVWGIPNSTRFQKDGDEQQTSQGTSGQESRAENLLSRIKSLARFMQAQTGVILIGVSFLSSMLAGESLDYLVQYASKKFEWSLAEANYLVSFRGINNLVLFLLILPSITRTLTSRHHFSPKDVDLWTSRVSSIFGIVGAIFLGLSPSATTLTLSLVIFTLAAGFSASIQSYGTSLVRVVDIAPFYSFLAVARIAGTLVGSPLLAAAFNVGLKLGGAGLGMHFYLSAGFFSIAGLGAWAVGLFDRGERGEDEDGV
ncbi:MFS general substrate transporter [Aspergillus steynii IBT 23096]|uniref:MFS general substrate transporter n=1 Tax=Aspergillus steynii IBT 23096 TaxID=1392250 RepID=A0A2I2FTZ3_9EURO|nr:MFS general substrate transporter [Aspergillus steynii IBT 23096]PLB44113.1 MFS general substrate transporter [Aspergillus steynii IBT 23096]